MGFTGRNINEQGNTEAALKIKLLQLFKTLNAAHFRDAQQAQVAPAFGIQLM